MYRKLDGKFYLTSVKLLNGWNSVYCINDVCCTPIIEFALEHGVCTLKHPIRLVVGKKKTGYLAIGANVHIPKNIHYWGGKKRVFEGNLCLQCL